MGTSGLVADRAISLMREGAETDAAVRDLLEMCHGSRVAVVMAKQRLEDEGGELPEVRGAVGLLDLTLERGDWAI
jgi:hypothetical protein